MSQPTALEATKIAAALAGNYPNLSSTDELLDAPIVERRCESGEDPFDHEAHSWIVQHAPVLDVDGPTVRATFAVTWMWCAGRVEDGPEVGR